MRSLNIFEGSVDVKRTVNNNSRPVLHRSVDNIDQQKAAGHVLRRSSFCVKIEYNLQGLFPECKRSMAIVTTRCLSGDLHKLVASLRGSFSTTYKERFTQYSSSITSLEEADMLNS